MVEATGERWWEAEIHYFRGELNLKSNGPRENSEASFMRAIDVARSQESKLYELRATTSLARLWHSQGKSQEAHDLIFPVHEWFNERFDTTDLKNAKAFLTELR